LVMLKANRFSGGQSFWSYRYPLGMLTALAPLLVLAWQEWTAKTAGRRTAFGVALAVSITLQAVGATCFRGPYVNRPWTLDYLGAALTGPDRLGAAALVTAGGLVTVAILVRALRSDRPQVLDVAGADRALHAVHVQT